MYVPFSPTSNTVKNITVTSTSVFYPFPNDGDANKPNNESGSQVILINLGTTEVYYALGDTTATAVEPSWDGTNGTHVLPANSRIILTIPSGNLFPTGVRGIAFVRASAGSDQRVSFELGNGGLT